LKICVNHVLHNAKLAHNKVISALLAQVNNICWLIHLLAFPNVLKDFMKVKVNVNVS